MLITIELASTCFLIGLGWRTFKILQIWVLPRTHDGIWLILQRWRGEWSAGWHLMEVGLKGTLVIMQGIGEGLC